MDAAIRKGYHFLNNAPSTKLYIRAREEERERRARDVGAMQRERAREMKLVRESKELCKILSRLAVSPRSACGRNAACRLPVPVQRLTRRVPWHRRDPVQRFVLHNMLANNVKELRPEPPRRRSKVTVRSTQPVVVRSLLPKRQRCATDPPPP